MNTTLCRMDASNPLYRQNLKTGLSYQVLPAFDSGYPVEMERRRARNVRISEGGLPEGVYLA